MGRRAPLQPGPHALVGVGRRDYSELREKRRDPRAAFVLRSGVRQLGLEEAFSSEASSLDAYPPPEFDGVPTVHTGNIQIVSQWETGKNVPEGLPEFLGIAALRAGEDFEVEQAPNCSAAPTHTWLVRNQRRDRVHPTAQERYHRFIVVGDDVSATLPGPSGSPPIRPSFRGLDEAVIDAMLEIAAPNATIAVRSSDGRLVYAKSFTWVDWYRRWFAHTDLSLLPGGKELGYLARPDGQLKISVTTPCSGFRWASVTKPMTAMMTLAMCASPDIAIALDSRVFPTRRGRAQAPWVELYDDMKVLFAETGETPREYYRRFDAAGGQPITAIQIKHLLTHTAGWSNGHDSDPRGAGTTGIKTSTAAERSAAVQFRTYPLQPRDALAGQFLDDWDSIKTQLLRGSAWPAGTARLYSNPGYALLAQILTYAGGDTIHRLMERWVFGPCGMPHSRLPDRVTLAERKAGDALFFARVALASISRESESWNDGWSDASEAFSQSQMTRTDGSPTDGGFPGYQPPRLRSYGGNSTPMKTGASGLVASAVDVSRFGFAMAMNNPASVILSAAWRALVWFGILPSLTWPRATTRLTQTFGFSRVASSGGAVRELSHGGETTGGASFLSIAGPQAANRRSGRTYEGMTWAFSMNRNRTYRDASDQSQPYARRPEAVIGATFRDPALIEAIEASTGDLEAP